MKRAVATTIPSTIRRRHRSDAVLRWGMIRHTQWSSSISSVDKCHLRSFSSQSFGDDNGNRRKNKNNSSSSSNSRTKRQHQHQHNPRRKQSREQQQRQKISHAQATPAKRTSVFATIQEAQDCMQELLDRLVEINENAVSVNKIVPITVETLAQRGESAWDHRVAGGFNDSDNDCGSWERRAAAYRETKDYFETLVQMVREGRLSPSRKHGKELSQLVECVLYVCSQQDPFSETSPSESLPLDVADFVGSVLRVLEVDWNLDVGHRHYERAIAACCNVGDWKVASRLFEKQIDPNAGGPPVSLSIENPLGLYALAMRCLDEETARSAPKNADDNDPTESAGPSMVAEHVMDAVQRLVMVSPSDQAGYVLAAGNALGHARASIELEDYRQSTVLSKDYGRPLVAACLRACCLEGDYGAGLDILKREGILSPSLVSTANLEEEWQWGGARDLMDPLCRDLALQVIGGAELDPKEEEEEDDDDDDDEGNKHYDSRLALELFRQGREEGVTISGEALLGVAEACERDKDWRTALSILRILIEEEENEMEQCRRDPSTNPLAPWVVPGSWLRIAERDQIDDGNGGRDTVLPELGSVLASIMRNCNQSSNFGMSLFALQLFRQQLLQSPPGDRLSEDSLSPDEAIAQMLFELRAAHPNHPMDQECEILTASMVALCGLRCPENAMRLYERMTTDGSAGETNHNHENAGASAAAAAVYRYASMNHERSGTAVLGNPWTSAHRHIDRLLTAGRLVRKLRRESRDQNGNKYSKDVLEGHRRGSIEELLARAMNSCTNAHQPELALYLLEWMEDCLFSQPKQRQQQQQQQDQPFSYAKPAPARDPMHSAGLYDDSVTAEIILACRWIRDFDTAIELFEAVLEKHCEDDLEEWRKTISAGLTAMIADGRGSDAVRVFEILDPNAKSAESYTTVGRHLSRAKDWTDLIDLYRNATEEGHSSEELSMLAMVAVTSTRVENRLRILRAIVDDCASGVGLDSKRWTTTKYWSLKRQLGFYHARLLMWWNDEQRAPLDEVNLAIKEFYAERANGMRPKNDVVRAIVSGASNHDSLGLETTGGYEKVPRSEEDWAALLGDVLRATTGSPIRCDPTFVESLVRAYKSLGRSRDCVEYVSDVLLGGAYEPHTQMHTHTQMNTQMQMHTQMHTLRLRQSTLVDVLEAARMEHADDLYNDVQMLLAQGTNNN